MSDASRIFPLRKRYMYQPTKSAIGIVQAIVNVPHELPGTSRTASSGRTQPVACRDRACQRVAARNRQVERLVEDHRLVRPVAEPIGRARRGS